MTNKIFSTTISALLACSLFSAPAFAAPQDHGTAPPPAAGDRPAAPGDHGSKDVKPGGNDRDKGKDVKPGGKDRDKGKDVKPGGKDRGKGKDVKPGSKDRDKGKDVKPAAHGHVPGKHGISRANAAPGPSINTTVRDRNTHLAPPRSAGTIIITPRKPFNKKFPA